MMGGLQDFLGDVERATVLLICVEFTFIDNFGLSIIFELKQ